MKEFVSIKNGISLSLDEIPVLNVDSWRDRIVSNSQTAGSRLISLFADENRDAIRLYCLMGNDESSELWLLATDIKKDHLSYPSLTSDLPEAHWFERELFEQHRINPVGHPCLKPIRNVENYPFYRVEGEEIHEVAVGPVHAGIIEPGHFRFQCHGEKVFHLEIQLGYQHRGIEAMFPRVKPSRQAILAESIAGDTAVVHSLSYAQVMEGLSGSSVPARGIQMRAIALELERIANHVGDLGMLSSDIAYLPVNAWLGRLRGEFLNLLMEMTGNRYGRSFVRPGGVLLDIAEERIANFQHRLIESGKEFQEIIDLFFSTTSVLDRFEGTGVISSELARSLGLVGPVARASGVNRDVRHHYPTGVYLIHRPPMVHLTSGDVYARARLRSLEVKHSLRRNCACCYD